VKQLTIITKDRVGLLSDVSNVLGEAKVNIESVSLETSRGMAVVRVLTRSPVRAKRALGKAGFKTVDSRVLVVRLRDRSGELAKATRILADNFVSVKNVYLLDTMKGEKLLAFETSDNALARRLLKQFV